MPTGTIATDKTYRLYGGVITDSVDSGSGTVHHINDASRQAYHAMLAQTDVIRCQVT